MRSILILSGLLALPSALLAQQADGQSPQDKVAATEFQTLKQKVTTFENEFRVKQREDARKAAEEAKKARAAGKPMRAMRMMGPPPLAKFIPEFQAGAAKYAGKDAAVPFLMWIASNGRSDKAACNQAVTTLVESHSSHDQVAELPAVLNRMNRQFGKDRVSELLTKLMKTSSNKKVRGHAMFQLAAPVVAKARIGSPEYRKAKFDVLAAADMSGDPALKSKLRGLVAGRESLSKGGTAPDISGVDLDGVEFKLSDYSGKIVMLDFWGDW